MEGSERPHPLVLPSYMLSSNQVLNQGRYRIIDHFGGTDTGRLYEAYDTVSDTKVVLRETVGQLGKVATAAQIENFKANFAADAKRLAEVDHPSLLKIKDFFSEIDRQYLVMESCEGNDLASLISGDEKGPGVADILRWADQILDGVHYLHSQDPRIIHQNVSPQNARLTSNFKVKLLVTATEKATGAADSDARELDDEDQAYRALEQLWLGLDSASQKMIANSFGESSEEILRSPLDARTDVYSVGATVYFLLTKTEPTDALARHLEILDGNDDPLQKASDINESVPKEVSEILMKAMELKREDRFESASAMRAELSKVTIPNRLADNRSPKMVSSLSEAEDAHLDEERLRVEKERLELETAQKRLEEERALIEKRKLELDAEKKRTAQMIAARRLEEQQKAENLEAEKAAAEKLKAAQAADEKARNERSELARRRIEAEKAASVVQPEVDKLQMELAKEDLLDLPEPAIERSAEPNVAADVLALDVEKPAVRASTAIDSSFDIYPDASNHGSFLSRPPILVAIAAAVLIGIIGVWMFAGSGSPAATPAASVQTPAGSVDNTQPTQSVDTFAADSNSSATQQRETPSSDVTAAVPADTKAEQDAKLKPHKQPTPQSKPAPEKKKVTVDDLINDN